MPSVGDIALSGDRIVALGRFAGKGAREIDATGLYVAPGFIDVHNHSEMGRLLHEGRGPSFALQGFTTDAQWRSQRSVGTLRSRKGSRLREGQEAFAIFPVEGSISAKTMPGGAEKRSFSRPETAAFMKRVQIGSAASEPERPRGWLSS